MDAIEAGEDVVLTADIQLNSQIPVTNSVVIDLGGHTVTSSVTTALFDVNGTTLKLKGQGTMNVAGRIANVRNGGTIIIEDGTYSSSRAEVVRVMDGTAIVNGGDLTGREGAVTCREGGSTVEINGGHLVGTDNFAVATNGSTNMGGNTVTINDGVLEGNITTSGYEAIGVYIANSDTVVINGGQIIAHGGTGLCMRAGDVTINGGTITATNVDKNGNVVPDGKVGDDKRVMEGCSAVIFDEESNYPGQGEMTMKLTINGGTITGVDHSVQVLSNAAEPAVEIKGGTLTPEPDQIFDSNADGDDELIFDANPDGETPENIYDGND